MKISQKQAIALLKKLGVDAEVVADDKDADKEFNPDTVIEEVTNGFKETLRPDIEAEYSKASEGAVFGRAVGTIRSAIGSAFNIPTRDLERLTRDKPFSEAVKIAVDTCKTTYDTAMGKDKTDWEKEREQLVAEHEAALERVTGEKDKEIGDWKNKYADRDINESLIRITEKIPRIKGDVTAHADMLRYRLMQKYDLKYDEAGKKLEFYEKGTGKKARLNNKDIAAEDIAKEEFTTLGMIQTDTRNINPSDIKNGKETGAQSGIQPLNVSHLPSNLQSLAVGLED